MPAILDPNSLDRFADLVAERVLAKLNNAPPVAPSTSALLGRERYLTHAEAAALVSLSQLTLARHVDAGKFPKPVKLGRGKRYRESEILKFLAERETAPLVTEAEREAGRANAQRSAEVRRAKAAEAAKAKAKATASRLKGR